MLLEDLREYYKTHELYCYGCLERMTLEHWAMCTCEVGCLTKKEMKRERRCRFKTRVKEKIREFAEFLGIFFPLWHP